MLLSQRLARDGEFLFRWRSFLPLALLPVLLAALPEAAAIDAGVTQTVSHGWTAACIGISFFGILIRAATVGFAPAGTSGRNTRCQVATTLNTTGLYSIVRNPLYLGNLWVILGVALWTKVWWVVLITGLIYWLYIERVIAAEEAYLAQRFGGQYGEWAARTPAFLPSVRRWRPAAVPFSLRAILNREYHGLFALGAAYLILEAALDLAIEGEMIGAWLVADIAWLLTFAATAVNYVIVRTIKRRTNLLYVPGR